MRDGCILLHCSLKWLLTSPGSDKETKQFLIGIGFPLIVLKSYHSQGAQKMGFIIHVKFFPNGFTLVPTTTLKEDPFSPHIAEKTGP